jgi:tight adherence protein C
MLAVLSGISASAALAVRADGVVSTRLDSIHLGGSGGGDDPGASWRALGRFGALDLLRGRTARRRITDRLRVCAWRRSADEILGLERAICAACIGLTALAPVPWPVLGPLVGFGMMRIPELFLAAAERRRLASADSELPQFIDLLAGASSAGLAAPAAFRRALEAVSGPLEEELAGVVRAVDFGARWRDELRGAADRMALPDLRRTVAALTRTESLGSPLSEAMRELASDVRAARRAAASERARTAPVKMLFPLVFLVLPAFLLLTVVPVLLSTVRSIH